MHRTIVAVNKELLYSAALRQKKEGWRVIGESTEIRDESGKRLFLLEIEKEEGDLHIMTPEEFAEKMRQISVKYFDNAEAAHGYGDDLLCEMLIELGYEKGIKIWINLERWYS